jgi:predicted dehydrogenase
MNSSFTTRRKFIQTTAVAVVAAPFVLNSCSEKETLNHACIGVGGMMGQGDLNNFLSHPRVRIIAICDVDESMLEKASELVPEARRYTDWREMLDKEADNIDSVNVTVPDHNHFIIAWNAIQKGKHVYCQKPMCHDVAEVRELTKAALEQGVITQLGTQYASSDNDRKAVQLIKEGAVGKIRHAYLCSNRPGAEKYRQAGPRPATGEAVPGGLNWDVWIGTAPMREYVADIYHPVQWRSWLDFGTGWSGDIGCHIFNPVWKGLSLKAPLDVKAVVQESWKNSPERRADTWPQANHIVWTFPGNELTESDKLTVEWFDGDIFPPQEIMDLFPGDPYPPESAMLVGTEGALLYGHGNDTVLLPHNKFSSYRMPKLKPRNHYHNFVDCCLNGNNPESPFSIAGPMTEAILLGTVAARVPDTLLQWDSENMKIPNNPDAEKLLSRTYREGWKVNGMF